MFKQITIFFFFSLIPFSSFSQDQLIATIGAVQANPELAKFQFRAKSDWIDGGHCVSKIKDFLE